jgi:hypothetical protein
LKDFTTKFTKNTKLRNGIQNSKGKKMPNPVESTPDKPKKISSKGKLFLYGLALLGLAWLAVEGYWGYFKLKIWLKGFGTGAFWVAGLIAGFVYFYMAHKIHIEIKALPRGAKQTGAYAAFGAALLLVNPIAVGLAVWLMTPPGTLQTIGEWFFIGASIGGGIVLGVERLFAKKKPKPVP